MAEGTARAVEGQEVGEGVGKVVAARAAKARLVGQGFQVMHALASQGAVLVRAQGINKVRFVRYLRALPTEMLDSTITSGGCPVCL